MPEPPCETGVMHAAVRSIWSPDAGPLDLEDYRPPSEDFDVLVCCVLGPDDGPGEELFYVRVCSPAAIARLLFADEGGSRFLRHMLAMGVWDPAEIRRRVEDLCRQTSGENWHEVATTLSRFLAWEFEDYRP